MGKTRHAASTCCRLDILTIKLGPCDIKFRTEVHDFKNDDKRIWYAIAAACIVSDNTNRETGRDYEAVMSETTISIADFRSGFL